MYRAMVLAVGGFALVVAILVGRAVYHRAEALSRQIPVVVAREDIEAYQTIRAEDVTVQMMPAVVKQIGVFQSVDEVSGRMALGRIPQGAPVLRALVATATPYLEDADDVLLSLAVSPERLPEELRPGQRLDLWDMDAHQLLAQDAELIAVEDGSITVVVDQAQVRALMAASETGALWPVLAPRERRPTPTPTVTVTPAPIPTATFTPTPTPTVSPTATRTPTPTTTPASHVRVRLDLLRRVNVRSGPGLDYRAIAQAAAGARFTKVGQEGEWTQVCCVGDVRGWIRSDLL